MSLKTIFQEGQKERRRRKSLGKVGSELKEKDAVLAAQLTALGQKAWEAKADISAFADQQAALADVQTTLNDLQAQAEQLQGQKQESEEKKKLENDRLASGQKETEEKKRELDKNLARQNSTLQAGRKESQQARDRLAAMARERSQLLSKLADPEANEAEKGEISKGLDLLAKEETALQTGITAREEAGKPIAALAASLQEGSNQMKKQLDDLRQEQKQITAELDKKISVAKNDLAKNGEKVREAESRQRLNFKTLGEKLSAARCSDPNLAAETAAVQNARNELEGVQAMMGGLQRQKDDTQVSAYKKMVAIIIGAIVLVAAIAVALILLFPAAP